MRHSILVSSIFLLASLGRADDAVPQVPDFAGELHGAKLARAEGKRPVLAVLWDPQVEGVPAPPAEEVDRLLFGERPSVVDWFRENSRGKLVVERAGCVGWLKAKKPGAHYWAPCDGTDPDGDGWLSGHVEKWAEAIRGAAETFDLRPYDLDGDGVLAPTELGLLVVIPAPGPFGTNRPPAGREVPAWEPLVVQGLTIPVIAEWYTGLPPNFGAPAHELSHLLLGLPDLYMTAPWPFAAAGYSLMDCSYASVHLDPFEKLKLGWLEPTAVSASGEHALPAIETTGRALIVHDAQRGPGEYFLVENRWAEGTYDAGVGPQGGGIAQSGIAVWHVIEDPAVYDRIELPTGGPGDWGRRGIRLVRANGGTPVDDRVALFSAGARLSDDTTPARLAWADGSATGMTIEVLDPAGAEVRVRVTIR